MISVTDLLNSLLLHHSSPTRASMQHDSRAPLIEEDGDLFVGHAPTHRPVVGLLPAWLARLWLTNLGLADGQDEYTTQKKHKYLRLPQQAATEHCTTSLHRKLPKDGYLSSFLAAAQSSPPHPSHRSRTTIYKGRRLLCTIALLSVAIASVLLLIELLYLIEASPGEVKRHVAPSANGSTSFKPDLPTAPSSHRPFPVHGDTSRREHWLLWSQKCHIPRLDAWDKSISDYVEYKEPLDCSEILREHNIFYPMTYVDENRLKFRDFALAAGAIVGHSCCYRRISRGSDDGADLEYGDECIRISEDSLEAPAALIQVRCDRFNYTNVHSFIVHDYEEELAFAQIMDQNLLQDQYYNVIIVGVDTVSQLNGRRQFNKTLALLESDLYQLLDFTGYNKVGENTFPNLIPLLTGLTPEQLLETRCWLATTYSMISETGDDYLDNCKYLWSFFQELGYLTYFSEDWPQASTFNYLKMGFKNVPTTFYGRPYTVARDPHTMPLMSNTLGCAECQYDQPLVQVDLNNLKSFIRVHQARPMFAFHWINCPMHDSLNGGSTVDSILQEFFRDVAEQARERTFVLFLSDHGWRWNDFVSTRIGHYEASLPMLKMSVPSHFIQHHPDLYENLKSHQSALVTPFDLFHTIINIRNLAAKDSFVEPYKATIKPHTRSHHLLKSSSSQSSTKPPHRKDFLGDLTLGAETKATTKQEPTKNGMNFKQQFSTLSMLASHTPEQLDRSCDDSGIPDSYCLCMEFLPVASDSSDVIGAANYLVYVHIYDLLEVHLDKCHFLDLHSITSSDRYVVAKKEPISNRSSAKNATAGPSEKDDDDADKIALYSTSIPQTIPRRTHHKLPSSEYRITVSTSPGEAIFHEVVRMYGDLEDCHNKVDQLNKLNFTSMEAVAKHKAVLEMNTVCKYVIHSESISRLNLYKDQSECINDQMEVKKVCYCR